MGAIRLDHLLDAASGRSLFVGLLGLGAVFLVISLLVLMYTRWGTFNPLRKCLALSLLAHLLLVGYSSLLYVAPAIPLFHDPAIRVSLAERPSAQPNMGGGGAAAAGRPGVRPARAAIDGKPWETFSGPSIASLGKADVPRAPVKGLPEPQRHAPAGPDNLMGARPLAQAPLVEIAAPNPRPLPQEAKPPQPKAERGAEPIQSPGPQSRQGARAAVAGQPQVARLTPIERSPRSPARSSQGGVPSALLERALSVPRLGDIPASSEPATVSAGMAELPASKPGAKPAEAATASAGGSQEGRDSGVAPPAASAASSGPSMPGAQAVDLKPPSMVSGTGEGGSDAGASGSPAQGAANLGPPQLPRNPRGQGDYSVPEVYRLRVASNRSQLSERLGATPGVETAVTVALKWLADNQEPDGRWSAKKHGAGRETNEAGRDRQAAGSQADSGVTGLALLAFAASGNTHRDGLHRNTVLRGVQYLLRIQGEDGNLGGDGQLYEFMYCHGMAALAVSELAGMTGDQRLREPLARAIAYTLAAQDPTGGGWRYRAREAGDTSQLGWQLMALKSADLAGISVPETTWQSALRFLNSVSGGNHRGLASYRPDEEFSHSMSAEALACRQFLGLARDTATAREAGDYLLGELPGEGDANLYYWYYGSIAMYQLQGSYWKRWSEALQKTLLATQRASGPLAGSWDPTTRWDGYGGRVYTTALATLCLEAYYRFLPLNSAADGNTESPARR